ncbi:carotenoid oxygenase family protein [Legionella donaldsonii]|uniref:carotenoid oxygenase family protein n=1 Tax=Legionella donaldsonii TaxID=45060 RepID=UPI00399C5CA1
MWQLLLGFLPWILFSTFYGQSQKEILLTLTITTLVLILTEWRQLLKGFILSWGTLLFFATIYVLTIVFKMNWVIQNAWMLSNLSLALIVWISLLIGKPFTLQYAYEQTPKQVWHTKGFWRVNQLLTIIWGIILSFSTVMYFIPWGATTASEIVYQILSYAPMIIGIWVSKKLPHWYRERQYRLRNKANPFLQNNFAPIHEESDFHNLVVQGKIPPDLQGCYMRNGPNPAFAPISYTFPLDGDGMIHAMYLEDGAIHYRNRYVKTKGLLLEQKLGRAIYSGIAMPIPPDPQLIGPNDDPGPFKNGAFIHIIQHAKHYLAMWEGGAAYEMDHELNTIGEWLAGTPQPLAVGPHTRLDPDTKDLYLINYDIQPPFLTCHKVNQQGNLIETRIIEKSCSTMMHDFVLTKNFLIFFDCPAVFDLAAMESGGNVLEWRAELGTRIGIASRQDKDKPPLWLTTEAFFVFHFANAYEIENKIIIDYVRHGRLNFGVQNKVVSSPPQMHRMEIDLREKAFQDSLLADYIVEFPTINNHYNSKIYHFIYAPTRLNNQLKPATFNGLVKYDLASKTTTVQDFGEQYSIGEVVFVPKPQAQSEDDGYLVFFAYDAKRNTSDFLIMDALDISKAPLAVIQLPRRVPEGLHGSWFEKIEK